MGKGIRPRQAFLPNAGRKDFLRRNASCACSKPMRCAEMRIHFLFGAARVRFIAAPKKRGAHVRPPLPFRQSPFAGPVRQPPDFRSAGEFNRTAFTADDQAFIESAIYFFIATADAEGRPDCSFKGGPPGFVRVTGPSELAFPDYDGNGMFKSLGNLLVNTNVGLLFIAMHGRPRRLRVNGTASVSRDDPLLAHTVGAQLIVRVTGAAPSSPIARAISPSSSWSSLRCTRLSRAAIPSSPPGRPSTIFKDAVHPRQPTSGAKRADEC